jgi:ABC-type sugar transport system permease subunit
VFEKHKEKSAATHRVPVRAGASCRYSLPASGVVIGMLLVVGPFLATVIRSLLYWDGDDAALSLQLCGLFSDPRFYQAVGNTALCGVGATIISCILGFSLAWVVSRTDMPGRRSFEILNLVPFFLSPYVGAISWIYLAAPNSGILQTFLAGTLGTSVQLPLIYSIGGVTWVLSLFYTPYVYLFVIAPMRQMDGALEDAARVHGASFWYRCATSPSRYCFPRCCRARSWCSSPAPGCSTYRWRWPHQKASGRCRRKSSRSCSTPPTSAAPRPSEWSS